MSIRGYHWNYLVWDASPGFFICFSSISSLPSKWPPPDLVRLVILDPGTIGMPEDVFPFLMFELSNKEVELVDILSWRWTAKKKEPKLFYIEIIYFIWINRRKILSLGKIYNDTVLQSNITSTSDNCKLKPKRVVPEYFMNIYCKTISNAWKKTFTRLLHVCLCKIKL